MARHHCYSTLLWNVITKIFNFAWWPNSFTQLLGASYLNVSDIIYHSSHCLLWPLANGGDTNLQPTTSVIELGWWKVTRAIITDRKAGFPIFTENSDYQLEECLCWPPNMLILWLPGSSYFSGSDCPALTQPSPHTSQGQLESGKLERKPWKLEDTNHKVGLVLVLILVVLSQFRSHI